MRIVLTFALNAGLNLFLGLAIAALLSADDYGHFAVGNTVSVVMAMALFDWLRLSATRFYGEKQRAAEPAIRATLNLLYGSLTAALVAATALAITFRVTFGLGPALLAAAAVAALANGFFDYYAALARARFQDRTYAILVIAKNILAFGLAIAACLMFRAPAAALAALSFGALLALIPVHRTLHDATGRKASRSQFTTFARYGFPIVSANVIYQVILLMNRGAVAGTFGFAESGQLSLATDMTFRLFLAIGSALDVFIFQLAVRREAEEGRGSAEGQLRTNMVVVVGILALLAVGYGMAMPAFEQALVPERYRGVYGSTSLILLPGIFAFCVGQFALNPMFQLSGRTVPVFVASLVTLGLDGLGLLMAPHAWGMVGVAGIHAASLVAGALVIGVWALRNAALRPPLSEMLKISSAAALTALAMAPLRMVSPAWLALGVATAVGTAVYLTVIVVLNVAGLRAAIVSRLPAWTGARMALRAQ